MLEREEVRCRRHNIKMEQEELTRLQDLLTERLKTLQTLCSHPEQEHLSLPPDRATVCIVCGKLLELKPLDNEEE